MQGKDIHWRDDRNIETLKSASMKCKTLKALSDFVGVPKHSIIYVLERYLPEVRNKYRTNSRPKHSYDKKVSAESQQDVEIPTPPNGAQFYLDAMFYKINSANKVMRHNGFE